MATKVTAPRNSISIVMPCLDAAGTIERSLRSATQQSSTPFEVIVADGGSADNTRDLASHFNSVHVLEGTDGDLYEGLNRAIDAATGAFVVLLNADDVLPPETLQAYSEAVEERPEVDVWTGSANFHGQFDLLLEPKERMTVPSSLHGIPSINSRLYRRSVLRDLRFEQRWGAAADKVFIHDLSRLPLKRARIDRPTYDYLAHEGSMTLGQSPTTRNKVRMAEVEIANRLLDRPLPDAKGYRRELEVFRLAQVWKARAGGVERAKLAAFPSVGLSARYLPLAVMRWYFHRGQMCGW